MPTDLKVCAFDCIYCQYGRTVLKTLLPERVSLPSVEDVVRELTAALQNPDYLDVITFSGNGEPTLHPDFGEIVCAVVDTRDRLAPSTPLGILSSGARVNIPRVRDALNSLDMRIMKLDVGDEETFKAINRPVAGLEFRELVACYGELDSVILQILLVKGPRENSSDVEVSKLIQAIEEIRPREVQIYTLVRPPSEGYVQPMPRVELEGIARRIEESSRVIVGVY